jgi:hypothetical protein
MKQTKGIHDYVFVLVAGGIPNFNNTTRMGTLEDNPLILDLIFSVINELENVIPHPRFNVGRFYQLVTPGKLLSKVDISIKTIFFLKSLHHIMSKYSSDS